MTNTPPSGKSAHKRILWLHTQPEHYFNRMMDDLAAGTGYTVPGMSTADLPQFQYIAAFAAHGHGWYAENAPKIAQTVFLRPVPGAENRNPGFREQYHIDWRADLLPLNFDAAVVSGYAWRTQRELIDDCHRRGIPVAIWSDSNLRADRGRSLKERLRRRLKKHFLRRIIDSADHLLTANRLGVAYWRYYGAPRTKITRCPCYTDYVRIDNARLMARQEIFRRFNLPADSRMIFSSARIVEDKGLDLLIRAFLQGDFARHGWIYVMAGTGPMESSFKALAGPALGKGIHFVGFQQPADNLTLMAHADLLALPSRFEPHGIVVGEALAAGTPVLASDVVGAAYDLIQYKKNGLIFKTEDLPDLTEKLRMACDNPELLASLRQAARPSFEDWYRQTTPTLIVPHVMHTLLSAKKS